MDIPKILPIWQPAGFSTHIISSKVGEKYGTITSHTGTLDPMAEGVIIILTGKERHMKYDYAAWTKEYVFEIVFGISTDTYDGLGIVTSFHGTHITKEALKDAISEFEGDYIQDVPPYSSVKVKGKPLHWFARNKKLAGVDIPRKAGQIHEIELVDFYSKGFGHIVENISDRIDLVTGDLRQDLIKTRWLQLRESLEETKSLQVAKVRVVMSRGMYVRSLAQDISAAVNDSGFVYSLVRTRNGEYTKKNVETMEDVFGKKYMDEFDFVSRTTS